jgi:hypothetical protein
MPLIAAMHRGTTNFLNVSQAVAHTDALLITGSPNTEKELFAHIEHRHPNLVRRMSGIETLDHPTDGQLVALARRFFKADDRMHS